MLATIQARIFGPSRAARRLAVRQYLDELRNAVPGETIPSVDIYRDYESLRDRFGWPELDPDVIARELESLGVRQFVAIKVPWGIRPPPSLALPAPEPVETPTSVEVSPEVEAEPELELELELDETKGRTVRVKTEAGSTSRDEALAELLGRLNRGETIPSQQSCAKAWVRSEGTVSEWFSAWRNAGLVPHPVREGRCNVINLRRKKAA